MVVPGVGMIVQQPHPDAQDQLARRPRSQGQIAKLDAIHLARASPLLRGVSGCRTHMEVLSLAPLITLLSLGRWRAALLAGNRKLREGCLDCLERLYAVLLGIGAESR